MDNKDQTPPYVGSYNSVVWAGSQLVAVGFEGSGNTVTGAILTSPDGIQWVERTSGTSRVLASAIWTGKQLVAVGEKGTILTSPNGVSWTARNTGTANWLTSITWTGNQLVAVGHPSTILSSPDGIAWSDRTQKTGFNLYSVTWTGERLVAVGSEGTILTSPEDPNSISPFRFADRGFSKANVMNIFGKGIYVIGPNSGQGAARAPCFSGLPLEDPT